MRFTLIDTKFAVVFSVQALFALTIQPGANAETQADKSISASAPFNKSWSSNIKITTDSNDIVVKGKHGLRIKVTNGSDRPVLFDGESASSRTLSREYKCVDIDSFEELNFVPPVLRSTLSVTRASATSKKHYFENGILSRIKLGLSEPLQTNQTMKNEQERFGQRILWPEDSCEGIILFPAEESLVGSELKVPAYSFFDTNDNAEISNKSEKQN